MLVYLNYLLTNIILAIMNFDTPLTGNPCTLKKTLAQISADILAKGDFHERLAPAVSEYSNLMFGLTGVNAEQSEGLADIHTGHGKAIGIFRAGFCINELFRTQRFCRGLYNAVNDKLQQHPNRAVHVVYAGTGPFATLALPVMMQFEPSQLQFTLLEINPESYDTLRDVLQQLNLEAYVKRLELCNAINWKVPGEDIDIVISETMNRALIKEPQINIMLNMVSQLGNKVIYIPQEITINLAWQKNDLSFTPISELYSFNLDSYTRIIAQSAGKPNWIFDTTTVNYQPAENAGLAYSTDVTVYKDDKLTGTDCSLNLLQKVKPQPQQPAVLQFTYHDGEVPGFVYQIADK